MLPEIRRIIAILLLAFTALAVSNIYWSFLNAQSLQQRADNPRLVEAEAAIQRGSIFDRRGLLLATTTDAVNDDGDTVQRLYPHPAASPVTGYYSLRYGVSGLEAGFDNWLRGVGLTGASEQQLNDLLHQPAQGGDIQLTLDLLLQETITSAFAGYTGAAVVVTLPDGAIRAMVSLPNFDANLLDNNWQALIDNSQAPLINRVTQGVYQPGGLLQTILMARAITERTPMDIVLQNSDQPVTLAGLDLTLTCLQTPLSNDLTLLEGYIFGCPDVFWQLSQSFSAEQLRESVQRFQLLEAPLIEGLATVTGEPPAPLSLLNNNQERYQQAAMGQGRMTVTPLQVMNVIAAIANNGNVPNYFLLKATRPPGEQSWLPSRQATLPQAMLTRQTADQIRVAMDIATQSGVTSAARNVTDLPIFGHVAAASSGPTESPLYWFIGAHRFPNQTAIAIVLVLEDAPSANEAARLGGVALDAAARAFAPQINVPAVTPTVSPE